jgi:hypothetical protein
VGEDGAGGKAEPLPVQPVARGAREVPVAMGDQAAQEVRAVQPVAQCHGVWEPKQEPAIRVCCKAKPRGAWRSRRTSRCDTDRTAFHPAAQREVRYRGWHGTLQHRQTNLTEESI